MKASDLVIKILTENSVNRAWYVQGGAISHVIDSAYQREINQKDFIFTCQTQKTTTKNLGAIAQAERLLTVSEIARTIGQSRQAAQRLVNALKKDALIKMIDNPKHKRAKFVAFTEQGEKYFGNYGINNYHGLLQALKLLQRWSYMPLFLP